MADSCCSVELKEIIENMNAELSQSHTKISELDAKVRRQEEGLLAAQKEMAKLQEENARLARDLKEENARLARDLKEENARLARDLKEENARLARDLKEVSIESTGNMADSCCSVELKEIIENMNAELSQSHTKISELDAKVRRQEEGLLAAQKEMAKLQEENARLARDLKEENARLARDLKEENARLARDLKEENARLARDLKESEEKYKAVHERLLLAEQKLAQFSLAQLHGMHMSLTILYFYFLVNETNDDAVGMDSLPDEIIVDVFGYLTHNQLGQIARVCRRWNVLTKSPVLWKKVNVEFSPSHRCQTTVAESFINGLPSCTTSIRLNFTGSGDWIENLHFAELFVKLQGKCPHLEEFILTDTELSHSLPSVIDLCTHFLQHVKYLVFIECIFPDYSARGEYFGISKIEILELFYCYFNCFSKPPFSRMPHLKQLHLYGTKVGDSLIEEDTSFLNQLHVLNVGGTGCTARTFQAIQNHGHNLKELYVCVCLLQDHDYTFTDLVFPHLKTMCVNGTFVTCEGVVSLIQSCPSLENVYVDEDVAESFAAHPLVVANRCKSGIVKAIDEIHIHNNYEIFN